MNADQTDELEALAAIYENDLTEISRNPPCFMIRIPDTDNLKERVQLKVTFTADYPNSLPNLEIPMRSKVLSTSQCDTLLTLLYSLAEENKGFPMVYSLVDEATQWLTDNINDAEPKDSNIIEDLSSLEVSTQLVKLEEPKTTGGRWEYVIGLVGKPSAGKSTFFNGCTTLDQAKTGAHPFTTIEPNIGKAFYSIPCPCSGRESRCHAAHGHSYNGERHIPVLLKDVAGLVPGAWEGKGRGNRFLNDLLDADVLLHIIDVSGTTNEKGEEVEDYNPANDVRWLRNELHQWMYQNIHSKWDNIVKRPEKLVAMFTGYHANKATIHTALRNAGIQEKELAEMRSWKEEVLHRIVDCFLDLRFPMFLVLNKADLPGAGDNINRIKAEFPTYSSLPVSAKSECILQSLSKQGCIDYDKGQSQFKVKGQLSPQQQLEVKAVQSTIERLGSTNVHQALCQAVSLRPPTYAFPVTDLDTWKSIRKGHTQGHLEQDVLRDCISLRKWSTVEDLYTVMLHYPVQLLTGDFVRAETLDQSTGKKRPMRKDEEISANNSILHIMTNKKSS